MQIFTPTGIILGKLQLKFNDVNTLMSTLLNQTFRHDLGQDTLGWKAMKPSWNENWIQLSWLIIKVPMRGWIYVLVNKNILHFFPLTTSIFSILRHCNLSVISVHIHSVSFILSESKSILQSHLTFIFKFFYNASYISFTITFKRFKLHKCYRMNCENLGRLGGSVS